MMKMSDVAAWTYCQRGDDGLVLNNRELTASEILLQVPKQHRTLAKALVQVHSHGLVASMCEQCKGKSGSDCSFLETLHVCSSMEHLSAMHFATMGMLPTYGHHLWAQHWNNMQQWNHRNMLAKKAKKDRNEKFEQAQKRRKAIQTSVNKATQKVKQARAQVQTLKGELKSELLDATEQRLTIQKELHNTNLKLHSETSAHVKKNLRMHAEYLGQKLSTASAQQSKIQGQITHLKTRLDEAINHRNQLTKRVTENQLHLHETTAQELQGMKRTVINTVMRAIMAEGNAEVEGTMDALESPRRIFSQPSTTHNVAKTSFRQSLKESLNNQVQDVCKQYNSKVLGLECKLGGKPEHFVPNTGDPSRVWTSGSESEKATIIGAHWKNEGASDHVDDWKKHADALNSMNTLDALESAKVEKKAREDQEKMEKQLSEKKKKQAEQKRARLADEVQEKEESIEEAKKELTELKESDN